MRARWWGRLIAISMVLGTFGVVIAAGPPDLRPEPPVREIYLMPNQGGSGFVNLHNVGQGTAVIGAIDPDAMCSGTGISLFNIPAAVAPSATGTVTVGCAAVATSGIRRCQFHVKEPGPLFSALADFTVLCITSTGLALTGPAMVQVPDAPVGSDGPTTTITITNPLPNPMFSSVSIQLGDQDGNFVVGAPCTNDGSGCDATIAVLGTTFPIQVHCRPQTLGLHTAVLYVAAGNGAKLGTPIGLSCNGTSAGNQPTISANPSSVSLARAVAAGPVTSMVHVTNIGGADLHVTSVARSSGVADWTVSVVGACTAAGCTLGAGSAFDVITTFDPTAIGSRNAVLRVVSDASNTPMLDVPLDGVGQGGTIALADNLGTPAALDLGTSPIGVTITSTFGLRNDGNVVLDPVNLAITQGGTEFGVAPAVTTIPAAGMRQITVSCTPTAAQTYTGMLEITAPTAGTGSPINVELKCAGTSGNLFATPSSVQLGEIRTGQPAVVRVLSLKTAGPPLTITTPPALMTTIAGMRVGAPSSTTITAATPSTFDLTIDPTADRDLTNTITVTAGTTLEIPVTGKVVTARIDASPEIMIGSFCVGQPTTGSMGRLSATGTATIGLPTQPTMAKMSGSPFQVSNTAPVAYPYQLPPGQSAAVEITPLRQSTAGEQTDQLTWTTDIANQTTVTTTVTARFIADGGAIAPQLVDFEPTVLRAAAAPHLIKIQNCGTEAMTLAGPQIVPTGDFRDESQSPLPATLAPNQVATIEVGFSPSRLGTRMATLTVTSSKGPLTVNLLGQGLTDPGAKRDTTSFYACDCRTGAPSGAGLVVLVVAVLGRRRRRAR